MEDLIEQAKSIYKWEWIDYEYFYKKGDYKHHYWQKSRLISLAFDKLINNRFTMKPINYSHGNEQGILALKIISQFQNSVEESGHIFATVHLPLIDYVSSSLSDKELPYQWMLDQIDKETDIIDPMESLKKLALESSLDNLIVVSHYSPNANKVIATTIAEWIEIRKIDLLPISEMK